MNNLLITGNPGIGKTTLIKKLVDFLKSKNQECNGFYTEEIRNNNYRIGFEIVTLDGKRGILAKKYSEPLSSLPRVGPYSVHLEEFERLVLPLFKKPKKVMIIDEVGKMEMFSFDFGASVTNLFDNKDIIVIATVPLKCETMLVKHLKERGDCQLIHVNQGNRNQLFLDIVKEFE